MKVIFLFLAFSLPALAVENENLQETFANRLQAYENAERSRIASEIAAERAEETARLEEAAAVRRIEQAQRQNDSSENEWVELKVLQALDAVLVKFHQSRITDAMFSDAPIYVYNRSDDATYRTASNRIYFTVTEGTNETFPQGSLCEAKYYVQRDVTLKESGIGMVPVEGTPADGVVSFGLASDSVRCSRADGTVVSLPEFFRTEVRIRRGTPINLSDISVNRRRE